MNFNPIYSPNFISSKLQGGHAACDPRSKVPPAQPASSSHRSPLLDLRGLSPYKVLVGESPQGTSPVAGKGAVGTEVPMSLIYQDAHWLSGQSTKFPADSKTGMSIHQAFRCQNPSSLPLWSASASDGNVSGTDHSVPATARKPLQAPLSHAFLGIFLGVWRGDMWR